MGDNEDNKDKDILTKDELIFFEPPNDCNKLPKEEHVPMVYFETSRTCIIPRVGYGDDRPYIEDPKERILKATITSRMHCNGAMLMLSFHVESKDEIRCYMYLNGQIMRFMPNDIRVLLPKFFDKEFGDNKGFAESKDAQKLVDAMKENLRDVRFNAFMKKYKSKNID